MKLFIIRHGNPNYEKDCLTPKGIKEAKLLQKKLKNIVFDRVYSSTCGRAIETCKIALKGHKYTPIMCDWAREDVGANYFIVKDGDKYAWPDYCSSLEKICKSPELYQYGSEWYKHPAFKGYNFEEGVKEMNKSVEDFLNDVGYSLDRKTAICNRLEDKEHYENVVIFAHGGFAKSFLSSLLCVPYPILSANVWWLETTSITVVDISGKEALPRILVHNHFTHREKKSLKDLYASKKNLEIHAKW